MFGFLMKKKNPVTKQDMKANYAALKNAVQKTDNFLISEPWTLAQARLEGEQGIKVQLGG